MVERRRRSRRGEGSQLREEILEAVNELLDEWDSVDRLTIRAVAAQVGVSAPSVYLQFKDKAELVWAALADKYEKLGEEMRSADRATTSNDPIEHLRAQIHAYCRFGLEHPGKYRIMYESRQPQVESYRVLEHPASVVSGSLRAATERCADAGCELALPSDEIAHLLWAGAHGELSLMHSLADRISADLVLQIADGLLDSLVLPPGDTFTSSAHRVRSPLSRELQSLLGHSPTSDS
ncbi:TetR/AcrR family transcriptional regulator [Brachybacterium sp. ACRRE]|uniref:TetR/AcrR family transcriptional regulator n=1 Tax=Brachybacterium sp. ACRRE TaxID=2918184 RepID=UPI001EF393C0|nr:TetR/AcrR family transcriptional regulator [Brachybacterium sp. ACRRE]